jgi:hypothetical protein
MIYGDRWRRQLLVIGVDATPKQNKPAVGFSIDGRQRSV